MYTTLIKTITTNPTCILYVCVVKGNFVSYYIISNPTKRYLSLMTKQINPYNHNYIMFHYLTLHITLHYILCVYVNQTGTYAFSLFLTKLVVANLAKQLI